MRLPPLHRLRVLRVRGRSMEPTLRDGDLALALWGVGPRAGDVAVVRLPPDTTGSPRPLSVKRVQGPDPGDTQRWWIDSDNPRHGVTSFDVGSVAREDVLAVVLVRVSPRPARLR